MRWRCFNICSDFCFRTLVLQLNSVQSICILRLSAIGDVCHAVAAVQAIQRVHPQAKITWVIGKVEAMLLEGVPGVEFVVFDKKQGRQAFKTLREQLNGREFDVLLNMQVAFRAGLASRCIRAKVKIGFDKARSKELHSWFINRRIAAKEQPHVLEGFMQFAEQLGVTDFTPHWQMPLSDTDKQNAMKLVGDDGEPLLVISPAASKAERNWLPERYAAVAEHAMAQGFRVAISGGPTAMEQQLADQIIAHCQQPVLNLVGKTSLKELTCVLGLATLVLAPDTGPAHMAVTQGTAVIGLYAHSNPKRTGPYLYQDYVVEVYNQAVQEQYGKPASELPWGVRAKGELMDRIAVDDVIAMFDKLVREHRL
ncbi:glycosyltransferase family 9 protein [Pseudoalteromonas sp. T1lg10]|uniref:glycosyltransferase family 9 protein n=1 Tax=Pseudoalteromonas sp. T1lg10 TaxID=2077093 RepID=UPI000CF6B238|nr:glycosyltransferase family 9 protein [Pseudoalteromonas sp. T1lg10]